MAELSENDMRRLRKTMAATGTAGFFPAFRNLMRARVSLATCLLLRFDPGKAPVLLNAWLSATRVPRSALQDYVETTYPFDPFFQFMDVPDGGGLYRLPEIAPDRFFSSEYYLEYYRSTGLCDEVGLLVPLPGGARAHVSMSRHEDMGPFKRRELHCLKSFAPLLLELVFQHVQAITPKAPARPAADVQPLSELIGAYAKDTLTTHLTRREAQIAALVLQGHSNASASLALNIARETCKVHRRNLYRKLAISSQRELFGFLKHLM
ncbi:MAG: helix-turn-helix transcriptional regulator [Pseudomonadota bacterium]